MRRSWMRRSVPRSASRNARRREVGSRTDSRVRVAPEPDNGLGDGVLVEAQIRARLFGAPILRLDAEVVLTPARTDRVGAAALASIEPNSTPRHVTPLPPRSGPPGSALAEAAALVEQTSQSLRHVNGHPSRGEGQR